MVHKHMTALAWLLCNQILSYTYRIPIFAGFNHIIELLMSYLWLLQFKFSSISIFLFSESVVIGK